MIFSPVPFVEFPPSYIPGVTITKRNNHYEPLFPKVAS